MKKRYLVLGLSAVLLFSSLSVSAAEFVFPEKKGGNVTINEELENVYTAGNLISVNANIKKGLYVGGSTVIVKGDVEGTVHTAGGNILIEGAIGDDLFVGGGNVTLTESSSVGGDLVAGAGTITINGPIGGNILLKGGEVFINSRVAGDVKIKVDKLELGDNAEIAGNLEYTSKNEIEIDKSKVLGKIIFHQKKTAVVFGLLTFAFLLKLLGVIAAGLIFVYLLKKFTEEIVKDSLQKFWPSLGLGFGALILVPVACIILAISLVGLWVAGILLAFYGLLIALSSVFASIILGTWLIKAITKKKEYVVDWRAVVVGVIVIKLLIFIPFVGWLAKLVFLLMGLGALVQWFYRKIVQGK